MGWLQIYFVRSRSYPNQQISLSKEQVYCEEIIDLAKKVKSFDVTAMFNKYGKYKKKGKNSKGEESMIKPNGNFTFYKATDQDLSNIDEDDEEDSDSVESFSGFHNDTNKKNNQLEQSIMIDELDNPHDQAEQNRNSGTYSTARNSQVHSSTIMNMSYNAPNYGLPTLSTQSQNLNQSLLNTLQQPIITNPVNYQMAPIQTNTNANTNNIFAELKELIQSGQKENKADFLTVNTNFTNLQTSVNEIKTRVTNIEDKVNKNIQEINTLKEKVNSQVSNKEIKSELEKLKKANTSSLDISKKVDQEIKAALANSQQEIKKTVDDTISSIRNRSQSLQLPSSQPRKPTAVWGDAKDNSENSEISRVYVFAASKIPKSDVYDEGWFKRSNQEIFDNNKIPAEVIAVEPVPSNHQTAKTKTFKILVKAKEGLNPDDLYNGKNWLRGTRISKFRKRSNTTLPEYRQPYRPRTTNMFDNNNLFGAYPANDNRAGVVGTTFNASSGEHGGEPENE